MSSVLSPLKPFIHPHGTSDFGIKVLASGGDAPTVDIVAIHGLDGHREKSFTASNGFFWLGKWLPKSIPNARILTYGYDGRTSGPNRSQQSLFHLSTDFLAKLSSYRVHTKTIDRPLIFIAHSFGGIILKYALIDAHLANDEHLPDHKAVESSTYGAIFLGTPHQGIDFTKWTHYLLKCLPVNHPTKDPILKHLDLHSETLQHQMTQYTGISIKYHTIFCYETYPTVGPGGSSAAIPISSAAVSGSVNVEVVAFHKNHMNLVQFGSMDDGDYIVLVQKLQDMVEMIPQRYKKILEKFNTAQLDRATADQMELFQQHM
ncbi:hypothetical protein BU17DRAFT_35470 [Hysterangium stoloniferum]|nr:hypothetical protein BU17DRAFT_35470 [Hysterangium stoloniferum]